MKRSVVMVVLLLLACAFSACGNGDREGYTEVGIQLVSNNPDGAAAVGPQAIPSEITSIVIEIYGPDMESIVDTIPITSEMWELPYLERSYVVPNGPDRHVWVRAFGSGGPSETPLYCGFEAQDLGGGGAFFMISMGTSC